VLRWVPDFDKLLGWEASPALSSSSGMAARRSEPASSYSSDDEPGLSRVGACEPLDEPLPEDFDDVDVSG
jgi:hypothetical protein